MIRILTIVLLSYIFWMENIQTEPTGPMTELLSSTEASFLNDIFKEEREGFDFFEKKIAFIYINGEWGKEAYFKMHTLHAEYANTPYPYPCNKGTLYIFNATQKDECGGYDAAIIYWSKRGYSNEDVVLLIKKHRLRIKKHRRDCQGVVWGSDHPKE